MRDPQEAHDPFNRTLRRRAGRHAPEPDDTPPPTPTQPRNFNDVIREAAGRTVVRRTEQDEPDDAP